MYIYFRMWCILGHNHFESEIVFKKYSFLEKKWHSMPPMWGKLCLWKEYLVVNCATDYKRFFVHTQKPVQGISWDLDHKTLLLVPLYILPVLSPMLIKDLIGKSRSSLLTVLF